MRVRLKWVHQDTDRHGNVRVYFWRRGSKSGPKVRIHEEPGSDAFLKRYRELVALSDMGGLAVVAPAIERPQTHTLGWLVAKYRNECPAYLALDRIGQRTRAGVLKHILAEPVAPGEPELYRDYPLDRLTGKSIRVLRDRKAGLPGSANNRMRALRALFKWASSDEDGDPIVEHNPAAKVSFMDEASEGWHTWTEAEVQQFEKRHPRGSKARLALALILYTGMRRSDVVDLGRQHFSIMDGEAWIQKRQHKGRKRRVVMLEIPVLPILEDEMVAGPAGNMTLLMTEQGKPFSAAGFGNWFRDRCNEAGLPHCSAHGLRKAGATRAAENGASVHQLMSIFGWLTMKEAEHYTRSAERRKMARAGMGFMARDVPTESVLTESVGTKEEENPIKTMGNLSDGAQKRTRRS